MKLIINGEEENIEADDIAELLQEKDINKSGVVVEHNKEIVKEKNWSHQKLEEGDQIELISFVGGG